MPRKKPDVPKLDVLEGVFTSGTFQPPIPPALPIGGSHDLLPPLTPDAVREIEQSGGVIIEDVPSVEDVPTPSNEVLHGVIENPPAADHVRYESRIQILDAFQYHGSVHDAPAWVDRNWIGYADNDPIREIPAGPCLRVPIGDGPDVVLCRDGDYVAQQSVTLHPGAAPIIRVEVWNRDMFHKLFLPSSPFQPRRNTTVPDRQGTFQPHPHLSQRDPAVPQGPYDTPAKSNLEMTPLTEGDAPDADGSASR